MTYEPKNWRKSGLAIWGEGPLCSNIRMANVVKHSPMNGIDADVNANIIAAAPYMLEALKGIVGSFHESVKTDESLEDFPNLYRCIQAIKEAEGK